MKIKRRILAVVVGFLACAIISPAAVTNTISFGGNSPRIDWDENVVTNSLVSPTEYSVSAGVKAFGADRYQNTDISNLVFTVTYTETNGYPMDFDPPWLGAQSSAFNPGSNDGRLDADEVLKFTVSFSDPDNKLLSLKVKGISTWWNTGATETMVFSDGTNNFSMTNTANGVVTNFDSTGLTQLSTNNVNTWQLLVSVDNSLGVTEAAMGALVLEYVADTDYVALSAPTNVTAEAFDGLVILNWDDAIALDLSSYNVYRSTNSGSYGAAIATGVTDNRYTDNTASNGVTYYYVVTAVDNRPSANESDVSAEVSAMPEVAVLPESPILFGSTNDGLGGFVQSTINTNLETWSIETNSVRYTADDTGYQNFSFLRQFALDRSPGQSYTMTASLRWNSYADDQNRIGIYLFGDYADLGVPPDQLEQYALGFIYNADQNDLRAVEGIDEDKINKVPKNGTPAAPTSDDIIDYSLTFEANIDFVNEMGTNYINVECVMTDDDGIKTTNSITPGIDSDYSGVAEEWTGDWFGFVGRGQNDRDSSGDEIYVANIESFFITNTTPVVNPLDDFEQWLQDNGLPLDEPATNDYDSDGVANLYEYGVGGSPTNAMDQGTSPTFTKVGDSFIYVHPKRSDTDLLTYTVETTTNLVSGIWTNTGYTVGGTLPGDPLNMVTNTVNTVEDEKFIRLKIEKTE